MSVIKFNRSVSLSEDGYLNITKKYADKNLSKEAMYYARPTTTGYKWEWGRTAAAVVFELPKLFNTTLPDVMTPLVNYCDEYIRAKGLTDSVIYSQFQLNWNKNIKA